jgi:sugar/nucleoside kinase (ribokinase family)
MVTVCLGDLVEDIVVWLGGPRAVGTDTPARIVRCRGGSAANVATFLASAGHASRFVGSVGVDAAGDQLLATLAAAGVEVTVQRTGVTGTIIVVVSEDGERSFLTDRGAAVSLNGLPEGALDGATWLHVPAYCLGPHPLQRTATEALALARSLGIRRSIDCSSTAVISAYGAAAFARWLDLVAPDVVFANHDEAKALGYPDAWRESGTLVIKHGADPTVIVDGSTGACWEIPVPPVDSVIDATGAGDAFAAGFLIALQSAVNVSSSTAAEQGHRFAAEVLAHPGASRTS